MGSSVFLMQLNANAQSNEINAQCSSIMTYWIVSVIVKTTYYTAKTQSLDSDSSFDDPSVKHELIAIYLYLYLLQNLTQNTIKHKKENTKYTSYKNYSYTAMTFRFNNNNYYYY